MQSFKNIINIKIFFIFLVLLVSISIEAFAHPGSLDENGGHYNHSTGEYHYHDGLHTESDYDENDSDNSISNSKKTGPFDRSKEVIGDILEIITLIFALLLISFYIFGFLSVLTEPLRDKWNSKKN